MPVDVFFISPEIASTYVLPGDAEEAAIFMEHFMDVDREHGLVKFITAPEELYSVRLIRPTFNRLKSYSYLFNKLQSPTNFSILHKEYFWFYHSSGKVPWWDVVADYAQEAYFMPDIPYFKFSRLELDMFRDELTNPILMEKPTITHVYRFTHIIYNDEEIPSYLWRNFLEKHGEEVG